MNEFRYLRYLAFYAALLLSPQVLLAADVSINLGNKLQKISGFGASSAWNSLTSAEEELLWDTLSGAGLSLHRLRIDETGLVSSTSNQTQLKIAQYAVKKGVTVWASPWAPVSSWQTNYGTDNSGNAKLRFNFAYGSQWATLLANYAKDIKSAGVPLYAISAQNEPDGSNFNHFSADSLALWIKNYLGPAMEGTGVKIIAPETVNWYSFPSYKKAILEDATASAYVPIIATHEYGGTPAAYPEIAAAGKEFWQTEIYESLDVTDPGINSAINTAILMHEALVTAGVNAWHYWWIHGPTGTSLFPNNVSTPAKRLWAMGNYSRFVRPGFSRIEATATPATGVRLSAYKDSSNTKAVVVIINSNSSDISLNFTIDGAVPTSMIPYVTDTTQDLKAQTEIAVSSNKITYSVPKRSITSLVFRLVEPTQGPYADTLVIPGTIEAENYDVGGAGYAYYDETSANEGDADFRTTESVDIVSGNSGKSVGYTVAGEWMEYTVNVAKAGTYTFDATVASGSKSSSFQLFLDNDAITDTVKVDSSSWTYYSAVSGTTKALAAGTHVLKIAITGSYVNIDRITFTDGTMKITASPAAKLTAGTYRIFDLQGTYLGEISLNAAEAPGTQVLRAVRQPGLYILKMQGRAFTVNASR